MTSSKPYLIRALYEWILDNGMTPYILVNALDSRADVPQEHVEEGRIVLNISPNAVRYINVGNDILELEARFSGRSRSVSLPVAAVLAIYARENGKGMFFPQEEEPEGSSSEEEATPPDEPPQPPRSKPSRSHLKVVK
jgi:stringent starvation protein B